MYVIVSGKTYKVQVAKYIGKGGRRRVKVTRDRMYYVRGGKKHYLKKGMRVYKGKKPKPKSKKGGSRRKSKKGGRRKKKSKGGRRKKKSEGSRRKSKKGTAKYGKDRGCTKQTSPKYMNRPSPPYPANNCRGKTMVGNDGKMYESKYAKNGYRWQKA